MYVSYSHSIKRTPALGDMKFTFLLYPSLLMITIYSVCMTYWYTIEFNILKEIHQFYIFYTKMMSPWSEGGGGAQEIYNFLSTSPEGEDWPSSYESSRKMLRHDGQRESARYG